MALCSAIIARAFRMAKIMGVGDEPTATEADEGMMVLRSIYQRLADTALSATDNFYYDGDVIAEEGERIFATGTVTLPELIDNERRPSDLAAVTYQDSTTEGLFVTYISDRGDWVRLTGLIEGDEAPLSNRNEEGLAALVALEVAETFGGEITQTMVKKASRFQSQVQPVDTSPVEYY